MTCHRLQNLLFCSILILCSCTKLTSLSQSVSSQPYSWKPLRVGAGGWVVGMDIHPTEPGLMYIRADVSGAYRWDSTSRWWTQLVTAASMPAADVAYAAYEGVNSIVGAPSDANIAYMAFRGQIYRSTNRGTNWLGTGFASHNVTMASNGPGRMEGERLSVDPHNSNVVYYGSIAHQLWVTFNGGTNWQKVTAIPAGLPGHGVNNIVFDRFSDTTGGKTHVVYVTVDGNGVYRSGDAGNSWTKISVDGADQLRYRDAELGPDGTFYVVANIDDGYTGGVWKYTVAAGWTDITPAGSLSYEDIAVNPANKDFLVVMRRGGMAWSTTNQGGAWTSKGFSRVSSSINWLGMQTDYWLSVGELVFDPKHPGRLWLAEGFSVWQSEDLNDGNITWIAEGKGIEETCGNAVICPPGGKPVSVMWDLGSFYHTDPNMYNAIRRRSFIVSGWGADWCPADPTFVAGVFYDHTKAHQPLNASGYSTDGGKTWTTFPSIANNTAPADLTYGTIAVSANSKENMVWLPTNNTLPYFTVDRGSTWQPSAFTGVTTSGLNDNYSARKPLCADRGLAGTFYFYHHLSGIYRSSDNGANWTKAGNAPALSRYNAQLKGVPGQAGQLWFAEGKQANVVGGLWRSNDGGISWSAVAGVEQAFTVGFGKAAAGSTGYPAIFVVGVVGGIHGIYRSDDEGATWVKISTYPLNIYDYVDDIDGDKDIFGKVYVCFASSGFAYGEMVAP